MIAISLNVARIPKGRTKEGKNGNRYLDLILIENKDGEDEWGNAGFVKPSATKEERENKVQLPICGNWKHIGQKAAPRAASAPPADPDLDADGEDDIPF